MFGHSLGTVFELQTQGLSADSDRPVTMENRPRCFVRMAHPGMCPWTHEKNTFFSHWESPSGGFCQGREAPREGEAKRRALQTPERRVCRVSGSM
jgi:hypothetical protein